MADLSKIRLNNIDYNFKDAYARDELEKFITVVARYNGSNFEINTTYFDLLKNDSEENFYPYSYWYGKDPILVLLKIINGDNDPVHIGLYMAHMNYYVLKLTQIDGDNVFWSNDVIIHNYNWSAATRVYYKGKQIKNKKYINVFAETDNETGDLAEIDLEDTLTYGSIYEELCNNNITPIIKLNIDNGDYYKYYYLESYSSSSQPLKFISIDSNEISYLEINTNSSVSLSEGVDFSQFVTEDGLPIVPTNVSAFTNDAGYLTTETDPTLRQKYGVCSTAKGTAAKTVTINGITELYEGLFIFVKFNNNNTAASPTLQVNSLDAKAIMRYGTTAPSTSAASSWNAGSVVLLIYDGTYWQMEEWNNTTYSSMTEAEITAGTGTTARIITPTRLKLAIETWSPQEEDDENVIEMLTDLGIYNATSLTPAIVGSAELDHAVVRE